MRSSVRAWVWVGDAAEPAQRELAEKSYHGSGSKRRFFYGFSLIVTNLRRREAIFGEAVYLLLQEVRLRKWVIGGRVPSLNGWKLFSRSPWRLDRRQTPSPTLLKMSTLHRRTKLLD